MAFGFGEDFAERIELGPGDVIWLRAGEAHAEEVVGERDAPRWWLAYIYAFRNRTGLIVRGRASPSGSSSDPYS